MRSFVHWLNVLLLAGYAWWAARVYDRLPDRIPMHFGGSGAPDRWAETSVWNWFLLVLVAFGVVGVTYGSAWLSVWTARHHPDWVNISHKERFLKLEADDRVFVLQPVCSLISWLATGLVVLFWLIHFWSFQVALGEIEGLPRAFLPVILALALGPLLFLPALLGHVRKRLEAVEGR